MGVRPLQERLKIDKGEKGGCCSMVITTRDLLLSGKIAHGEGPDHELGRVLVEGEGGEPLLLFLVAELPAVEPVHHEHDSGLRPQEGDRVEGEAAKSGVVNVQEQVQKLVEPGRGAGKDARGNLRAKSEGFRLTSAFSSGAPGC